MAFKGSFVKLGSPIHRARSAKACFEASVTRWMYVAEPGPPVAASFACDSRSGRDSSIAITCANTTPPLLGGGIVMMLRPWNVVRSGARSSGR